MKTRHLTKKEIEEMATFAVGDYYYSRSWESARRSAFSCAADEFRVKATKAQIAEAVKLAKRIWIGAEVTA